MAVTDTSYGGYLAKVRGSESGGNANAKNPRSSASGLYQFTKGTWEGLGYDWKDRFNTGLQNQAMSKLTSTNANYLKSKLGISPSDADLYGAHFLGPSRYSSVYQASSNTPLSNILSAGEISANPFLKGKTAGYLKNWLSSKMGQNVSQGPYEDYGVDTSLNLPMNTGDYQTAPDTPSKEDVEAEQAKAELLQKQKEKNFLAEVQNQQEQDTERRQQQDELYQQQQQQDTGIDPAYYQMPQIALPEYIAPQQMQQQEQFKDGGELEMYKEGGGIPERYKNMGFTRVGQKKEGDGQKKWKVLAKKGDKYKVVQGGYRGMQDFSQHKSKQRQDNFWSRMGGKNSAKAQDPFSPLYWHKRLGKWEDGGEIGGKVECGNCGWSWDKKDSSEEDMYICHKCGKDNEIKKYEDGGDTSNFDNNSARDWWVKKTGKSWEEAKKLGYSDGTSNSNIKLLNQLKDKNFTLNKENTKVVQRTIPRSDMKQFKGFSQEEQISMQNTQPPVTRKSVALPVTKAKKDLKEVDKIAAFERVMRGQIPSQGNEMKLQNGVITDKRTNTTYIVENGNIKKSFPVLTGTNPDVNINDRGVAYLETHPESKATPRGTYIMNPKADIYGQPGFRLNPVAAFGEPAARAKDIAQHVTYPGDFEKRNPLYSQEAKNRYASYGCVNCRKPDINYMTDRFKKGDTTMVIDSKIKRDANFLAKKLFSRK